jgi:thioredoxin-like negative regulator of GroEL
MSRLINNQKEFEELIKDKDGVFVMVYASWCPHSKHFLPIFEDRSKDKNCARVVADDLEDIADQFDVDIYPTVLYFKQGKLARRLDGVPGIGLDDKKLKDFIGACG